MDVPMDAPKDEGGKEGRCIMCGKETRGGIVDKIGGRIVEYLCYEHYEDGSYADFLATQRQAKRQAKEYSFSLPIPPSANRYWQVYNNRIVVTDEAKQYKQAVYYQLRDYEPLRGDVAVNFTVFCPARRGDLDNYTKIMFDALNGLVWLDDMQVVEIHSFRADDKKNPRVEFLVYEVE